MPGRTWRSQKSMRSQRLKAKREKLCHRATRGGPILKCLRASPVRGGALRHAQLKMKREKSCHRQAGYLQVLYGQWQLCGSSEDIKDARWALSSTFMALSLGLQFFGHVVILFDKKLVHALCRRQEEDARWALSSTFMALSLGFLF